MTLPTKPSELTKRTTRTDGSKFFEYDGMFMAYNDPHSEDYPVVVFQHDTNADPEEDSLGIHVMSFKSKEEFEKWANGEAPDPENLEPIEGEDADELASVEGVTLLSVNNQPD